MKNMRWLISGFLMGLVMALAPSCGPTSAKCNASTCPAGCCTAEGRCEPGAQTSACGISGNACQECGFNQQCQAGVCAFLSNPNADGGTKPKDGGMNENDGGPNNDCLPTECKAQNGACIPFSQQNNLQCGNLGNSCTPCTNPLTCDTTVGACRDTTCNGCVSNGTCVTGNSNSACGIAGVACDVCGSGETCQNGVCTGGSSCGPGNCNGCCQNGVCVSGNSQSACGTGGNVCTSCSSGTCSAGVCNSSGTASVGSACSTNSDCAAVGVGAICKKTTSAGNGSYSGGYCTMPCNAPGTCGSGADCFNLAGVGEGDIQCYDLCSTSDPCRAGYKCYGDPDGFCFIDPLPTAPTPPFGTLGSTCTQDTTCQGSGSYPAGFCYPSVNPSSGSNTGFTGGYCMGDCSIDPNSCGSDGACVAVPTSSGGQVGYCFKACSSPGGGQSTCRSGYVCSNLPAYDGSGTVTTGVGGCFPSCNNPGQTCQSGTTCQVSGYCQ